MIWARGLVVLLGLVSSGAAAELSPNVNYLLRCQGCHMTDGRGLPSSGIPDFVDQVGVFAGLPEGRQYLLHVPGVIGSSLTDAEIAGVLNYIMDTYAGPSLPEGNTAFTAEEVNALRKADVGNVVKYRRIVAEKLAQAGISVADYPWP